MADEHSQDESDGVLVGQLALSKRDVATFDRMLEFFSDEDRFNSLKDLVKLWQTLGGFGWFGRVMIIGVISLVSFVGAVAVMLHWAGWTGGGAK